MPRCFCGLVENGYACDGACCQKPSFAQRLLKGAKTRRYSCEFLENVKAMNGRILSDGLLYAPSYGPVVYAQEDPDEGVSPTYSPGDMSPGRLSAGITGGRLSGRRSSRSGLRLVSVTRSRRSGKKYDALFQLPNGRTKTFSFGAAGYQDFTMHHDTERRSRYIQRHARREDWSDPTKAGTLSRYILWGNSSSVARAVQDYKRRFGI